ncbi:MAG TPA: aldehyde dehydrogenase family protein [Mycobacteriales bacterium]|nr:aldehyde dehydrogenase family protein [Mycobacteriales bacterium]
MTTVDSRSADAGAAGPAAGAVETFGSLNPATGEPVGQFPVDDAAAVAAAVARARPAAQWWDRLGFGGRAARLAEWRRRLASRLPELAELMHRENGKPVDDATIELVAMLEHVDWAGRHAEKVLGRRSVKTGVLLKNHVATLEYQPYGVVGVIGPWNYPVFTPMGSIVYALAAGNAVVFKPSEFTPAVGSWLVDSFAELVPEHPVLQVVTGLGPTGAALCRSGVDKLAFTGSTATGKKVMAACAETLTPVVIECGGKDAMIVDADADLDAAADAALWGGLSNSGQTCVGIERVYAVDAIYDDLVGKLVERARTLRPGSDREASYGPMTMPSQVDVVRRHIEDALARGARAVVGGLESVRPPYISPVVLVDVPEDALAVQEETFGPTLTVSRVPDVEEAVRRANGTPYGLAAAVFSKSRGEAIARRIRSGMASVNSVVTFSGVAALPFGGVGASGFGRIHGEDGLREFARSKAITRQRFGAPVELTTFARKENAMRRLATIVQMVYGRPTRRK